MKNYLTLLLLLITSFSFSQIKYEKGYFIDDKGNKTECLIKDEDWRFAPSQFDYKLTNEDKKNVAKIENINEFGVYNQVKYIKASIEIDRSTENLQDFASAEEQPLFVKETRFLKVLLEGEQNLYSYQEGNFIKYFIKDKDNNIKQLVYKR